MADELLDIVNDNDEVTRQEMRFTVHQKGLQHRGVHVFLFNERGEMLIQKRSEDRASSPSMLDCSVSEHVKAGESYFAAAVRGMREELGVEGIEITLLGKIQMEYGPNDLEISQIYTGVVKPEQVQFDPQEIAGIRFMSLDEIDAEISAAPETYCIWFIELMNWYHGRAAGLSELENFIKR